jgi:hypothetical protein
MMNCYSRNQFLPEHRITIFPDSVRYRFSKLLWKLKTRTLPGSSVISWLKNLFFLAAFATLATGWSSCNEPDELGLGLLPSSDQLNVRSTDTITIESTTENGDSLLTNKNFLTYLLGSYTDPEFGRTDASVYSQLVFSSNPNLGDTNEILTADSLVMTLEYTSEAILKPYYGNKNTPLKVTVYRMTESMSPDSVYYTNRDFTVEGTPIGTATIIPQPDDSVSVYGKNVTPHVRIKLSNELANDLLELNHSTTWSSSENWLDYFKGVYIKTEPVNSTNEGSVIHFSLGGNYSAMTLFYHSDTPGDDSTKYSFVFRGEIINRFHHEYGQSDAGRQIQDPSFNSSVNYLQAMSGVRTHLNFPYLKNFTTQGQLVINKAELIIPVETNSTETYSPPVTLNILTKDSTGRALSLIDYIHESLYFGGAYSLADNSYTFNITRQVQAILGGTEDADKYYLVVPYVVRGSVIYSQNSRVVINSGSNATRPIRLKLYYTVLN